MITDEEIAAIRAEFAAGGDPCERGLSLTDLASDALTIVPKLLDERDALWVEVERLNRTVHQCPACGEAYESQAGLIPPASGYTSYLMEAQHDLALKIEENERLKEHVAKCQEANAALTRERDEAVAKADQWRLRLTNENENLDAASTRIAELEADGAALREALQGLVNEWSGDPAGDHPFQDAQEALAAHPGAAIAERVERLEAPLKLRIRRLRKALKEVNATRFGPRTSVKRGTSGYTGQHFDDRESRIYPGECFCAACIAHRALSLDAKGAK